MATAGSFIARALQKAGIRTSESPIEASEMQDGLDALNDMLISWEMSGIMLGFSPVADKDDDVRVPRFAHAAIKAELAVIMGPEYSKVADPVLLAEAQARKDELMTAVIKIGEVEFPDTLPTGSGNNCAGFVTDRRFFPANERDNF
tara:strand:+ start:2259 stop:2696 length:438 start_codon:yes stop_codon:yes gene_type:complete